MKALIKKVSETVSAKRNTLSPLEIIYEKYQSYTMIPKSIYIGNLLLSQRALTVPGDIYECGVWKGGMSAGIAELLGKEKKYYLFDSFEGLPEAKEIDGATAIEWQQDTQASSYFENCSAEERFAINAMAQTNVHHQIIKGWFNETLPSFKCSNPIALLRLDGDWYESTLDCLKHLYPHVSNDGIVIIDDYYAWDGCSRAVHHYLASINSSSRINTSVEGIAYIIKKDKI